MHELPVINKIVDICLAHAMRNNVKRIISIELKVGSLSDLQPEWMQRYFDSVSQKTLAAGANLKIEKIPAVFKCRGCSHEFHTEVDINSDIACPKCLKNEISLVSGHDYFIGNMEVI